MACSRNLAKYLPSSSIIKRVFTCKAAPLFQKKVKARLKGTDEQKKKPCAVSKPRSDLINVSSHTDLKVPDFDFYRRRSTRDPSRPSRETLDRRRTSTALASLMYGVAGMYAGKTVVHELVASMAITQDMLALAKIEVNLHSIPEGRTVALKWRGKPVFIWHRSPESIDLARNVDLSTLRDPESDEDRFERPEWLIVIGVCTHLGCVPLPNSGDYGGFYCPCHGTHYDSSGRVRKGPAPTNLVIPEYQFDGDNLIIG